MKKFFRNCINSNMLKTIAIIAMVIDHIGFYFSDKLNPNIVLILRYIGRIAMPIFIYLLVQGFFYTKNFKKYILRVGLFAVITQVLITILMVINKKYYPEYTAAKQVYSTGNILFTFVLCLSLMKVIHENILVKKWDYSKNLSLKVIIVILIYVISMLLPIDYGREAIILCNLIYFIERFKIQIYIDKTNKNNNLTNTLLGVISDTKIEVIYVLLIFLSLVTMYFSFNTNITILLAIIPILLYNGEKGKCNNFVKYMYYIIFPLQHTLLYIIGMLT